MRRAVTGALLAAVVLAGCASPEASRDRGQPGADVGNRSATLEMHGGSDPAHDTPRVGKAAGMRGSAAPQASGR